MPEHTGDKVHLTTQTLQQGNDHYPNIPTLKDMIAQVEVFECSACLMQWGSCQVETKCIRCESKDLVVLDHVNPPLF